MRTLPIVAAPMAGGPSTVELAAAVATAGGLPFLAGGYRTAAGIADEVARLRATGAARFGVNLFVPSPDGVDRAAFAAYAARLRPEAERFGLRLDPEPVTGDDDGWGEKLALLLAQPVPIVSLTFGLPPAADIAALRDVGTEVLATVTSLPEARAAAAAGVDGLVVQGPGAGGHSAVHAPHAEPAPAQGDADRAADLGSAATARLVREVRGGVDLPVIAAGGVDGPAAVRELLEAGARAVAIGTLLLRAPESGTNPVHRAALGDPRFVGLSGSGTALTRAFTGRPARALRNRFLEAHTGRAPTAYPAVHHLTRELRRAAVRAGDAEVVHLWAGTGFRAARNAPAAETIAWLASELPAS